MKIIILSLVLVLVSPLSWAKKVKYRKTQKVSFDGQDVDGQVRSPDGAFLSPKKGMKFMPLYKVETRFDKAIKESVEFVRVE